MTVYTVTPLRGEQRTIAVKGRNHWALTSLLKAGTKGCTPITDPAPRWSAYVHNLRKMGFDIVTITEAHGGNYPGTHARYVLRSQVQEGGAT